MEKTIKTTSLILVAALVAMSAMFITASSARADSHTCSIKGSVSFDEFEQLTEADITLVTTGARRFEGEAERIENTQYSYINSDIRERGGSMDAQITDIFTGGFVKEVSGKLRLVPPYSDEADNKAGLVCLYSSVKQVTTIVKIIIFVVAALLFMVAAAMYATAGDNTDQQTKAKKFITSGVIGIVIALIAHFIPNLVRTFF